MKGHVFISYARRDGAAHAERVDLCLARAGLRTWRDTRGIDPSADFTAEIETAIEAASHVVACITPDVKRDDSFVRREIGYALAVKVPIVVARFAAIVPPVSVVNHTQFDFIDDWDAPFARLQAHLHQGPAGRPAGGAETRPADPHRDYLEALYRQIVVFLERTVFTPAGGAGATVIALQAEQASGATPPAKVVHALPRAFFDLAGASDDDAGADAPARLFPTLADAFHSHRGRTLLLGAPGSGKTTAAMAFARDAVARRLDDASAPLPVVLPIVAWDPQARPGLGAWIAELVPPLAPHIGGELARGTTLLVLDGLDELGDRIPGGSSAEPGPDPRALFLDLLPAGNQVLMTSRLAEFQRVGRQAPLNGAVTLRALDDAQVDAYLERSPGLLAVLAGQPGLRDALRIPLLLSLFAVAFHDQDAAALGALSTGGVRDAIFEQFIRSRHAHEARKPHAALPFSLDELYDRLGSMVARVTPYLAGGSHWHAPTLITGEHIRDRFGDEQGALLTEFLVRLNLLVPTDATRFRFLHLLLRDHLAFRQAFRLARSSTAVVRVGAMAILGALRDPRALPVLVAGTQDTRQQVRWEATSALAALQAPAAADALVGMLADRSQPTLGDAYDQTPLAMTIAADGLVALGAAAVPALVAALEDDRAQVRGLAADCLGRIGAAQALGALQRCAAATGPQDSTDIGWSTEPVAEVVARAIRRIAPG